MRYGVWTGDHCCGHSLTIWHDKGFAIQNLFTVPVQLAVLGFGYYLVNLDLDSYLLFWVISFSTDTICLLVMLIILPESMPDQLRKPLEWTDLNPFRQYWSCLKVVFAYPLLICEFVNGHCVVLGFASKKRAGRTKPGRELQNPIQKVDLSSSSRITRPSWTL